MSQFETLQLSPPQQELSIPTSLLVENGWTHFRADTQVENAVLEIFLSELSVEDCGHSWRNFLSEKSVGDGTENVVERLHRALTIRPTALFVYMATRLDGAEEAVALATISDRVNRTFQHEGFPVLARCFIRPAFRGLGLYPHLVRHRLGLCRSYWGERLRAIHLGAANTNVLASLKQISEWDNGLTHVGDEMLQVAERSYQVVDLLALTNPYRSALIDTLPRSSPGAVQWSKRFAAYLRNGVKEADYGAIRSSWEQLNLEAPAPLKQFFDLLDEIGVIR